jgi:hypothetical protein
MENKLQNFTTFSQARTKVLEDRAKLEANSKRQVEATRFMELLAEYGVTSVNELEQEKRTEFFTSLLNETELETEGNAFGAAVKKAKEEGEDEFEVDGETYKVESATNEGRAFVAAVNKAREAGEKTFEFNGKTYKVKKAKTVNETEISEGEITSDEQFTEYATAMYKEAFGDDYDEEKASAAIEGMLKKADGDYGSAIGMLQSSLG